MVGTFEGKIQAATGFVSACRHWTDEFAPQSDRDDPSIAPTWPEPGRLGREAAREGAIQPEPWPSQSVRSVSATSSRAARRPGIRATRLAMANNPTTVRANASHGTSGADTT